MTPGPIFFLTDFGRADAYVGVVEARIAALAPAARVVHLTHGVPPQDLRNASWQLHAAVPHLPAGSIVLVVVDPGVGSARRAVVVQAESHLYVAPDNGVLTSSFRHDPPRAAWALTNPAYRADDVSMTFHGRDIFGPAAAFLANGVTPSAFGPEVPLSELDRSGVVPHEGPAGEVWTFDRFGNAITTMLAPSETPSDVKVGGRSVPWARTYADVEVGQACALVGSSGLVEVSVRDGSARAQLGLSGREPVALG